MRFLAYLYKYFKEVDFSSSFSDINLKNSSQLKEESTIQQNREAGSESSGLLRGQIKETGITSQIQEEAPPGNFKRNLISEIDHLLI
jgi:hypothetical protein